MWYRNYQLPLLTLPKQKAELIGNQGIDACIMINFNRSIALISAEEWIKNILWKQLHLESIFLGRDSYFGRNQQGNIKLLSQWSKHLGFQVHTVDAMRIEKEPISSTLIRNFIQQGNLNKAKKLLGRQYSVIGTVVPGRGKGRQIGFPTANIVPKNQCLPPSGVYPVWTKIQQDIVPGIANIGFQPTMQKNKRGKGCSPVLEIHIFDKNYQLYGQEIEVGFTTKLRPELKFANISLLTQQIKKDIISAKDILSKAENNVTYCKRST